MRFKSAKKQKRWGALGVVLAAVIVFYICLPEKAWARDPFELPPGVQLRAAEKVGPSEDIKPNIKKVTAILITGSRKVASIDHKVVAVGDIIDGEKVLEIEPDRVILEKGGRRKVITLEASPSKWTKDEGK
jgi:hypothetical protein